MNQAQENELSMYITVDTLCTNNAPIVKSLPIFSQQHSLLQDLIARVNTTRGKQETDITGITEDKKQSALKLVSKTVKAIGAAKAFALITKNNELKTAVDYSKSDLINLDDTGLAQTTQSIRDRIAGLSVDLTDYGWGASESAELQSLIDNYKTIEQKPRTAKAESVAATAQIAGLLTEGKGILEVMDSLSLSFKETEPVFFSEYKNAREIIDFGRRSEDPVTPA